MHKLLGLLSRAAQPRSRKGDDGRRRELVLYPDEEELYAGGNICGCGVAVLGG